MPRLHLLYIDLGAVVESNDGGLRALTKGVL